MNNLKLNKLNQISDALKNVIKGGYIPTATCTCGCCYANNGGSSVANNRDANYEKGAYTQCDYVKDWK